MGSRPRRGPGWIVWGALAFALVGCIELFVEPTPRSRGSSGDIGVEVDGSASAGDAAPLDRGGLDLGGADATADLGPDAALRIDAGCTPSVEACNGLDDDCDGAVDEGQGGVCCHADDPTPPCNGCPTGSRRPCAGWVCIPPGAFVMGEEGNDQAMPHSVEISQPFWMMATEVTRADWLAVAQVTDPHPPGDPAYFINQSPTCSGEAELRCPVERVSWLDAVWHAMARGARDGLGVCYQRDGFMTCTGSPHGGCAPTEVAPDVLIPECDATTDGQVCPPKAVAGWSTVELRCPGYRLPTEAEWAYAHRAGSTTTYIGGDHVNDLLAAGWFERNSAETPQQVAITKRLPPPGDPPTPDEVPPNRWGLHDTHGNVAEWVQDVRLPFCNVEGACDAPRVDPVVHDEDAELSRVIRGCAWSDDAQVCRSGGREGRRVDERSHRVGFRLVRPMIPMHPDPPGCGE